MSIAWELLDESPRLLMEARLKPSQGARFQPTGFPDLGPATYDVPGDRSMTHALLVESAQSMANRLEAVTWDEVNNDVWPALKGMPYVRVTLWNDQKTSSITEAHRLNSPYIINDPSFQAGLRKEAGLPEIVKGKKKAAAGATDVDPGDDGEDSGGAGMIDRRKVAAAVFRRDPCSVLHGVFLAKKELAGGRARLQRCLSAFIEATNVQMAASGGVKNDQVAPSPGVLKAIGLKVGAGEGYGNVPFHRTEFTAETVTAYFAIDLAQIRAYGIGEEGLAEKFLVSLALWKIRRFLNMGLRLRTACDLELTEGISVTRPQGFQIPDAEELGKELSGLVQSCTEQGLFASPSVTELTFPGK